VWTNYPLISNSSLDYFATKGMNTIRVSIVWERLQQTLYGSFDANYVGYIVWLITPPYYPVNR
jgi:aryl-phospho-beta-D-glucosidase BglC (GH1 family)